MKFNNFKEFLKGEKIFEAVKEVKFKVLINNVEYEVIRHSHLRQKRSGDTKPKDFKMTKNKYRKVLEKVLNSDLNFNDSITVTWVENNKSNALSLDVFENNTISIFGAIMNSNLEQDKLYSIAKQRLKISLN